MIGRIRAAAVAVAAVVLAALLMAPGLVTANAQEDAPAAAPTKPKAAPEAAHGPGGYVEFRSIDGFLYGHVIIAYGRLGARGQAADIHYAGFEPESGWVGLIAGHIGPVAGIVRTNKESANFAVVDSYRRKLNEQQYRNLVAAVETAKRKKYYWNAWANNCLDFLADMAHAVGMRAPGNLVHPYVYIAVMRSMNEPSASAATH